MNSEYLQYLLLALVQGITEFLPVSSSAHLILAPYFFSLPDQGLTVDVALHFGSMIAIAVYVLQQGTKQEGFTLAVSVSLLKKAAVAVLPTVLLVPFLADALAPYARSTVVIGVALIFFAGVLYGASRRQGDKQLSELSYGDALLIGMAQVVAIIPGTSRSGITISAGLALGLRPLCAIQFSFLLALPTLFGAAAYQLVRSYQNREVLDYPLLFFGIAASAVFSYIALAVLITMVSRFGFTPFVIYRIALGSALLLLSIG